MKRLLGLSIAVATTALVVGVAASGAGDAKGPPCADFVTGEGSYSTDTATGNRIVGFNVTTAKAGCEWITYTLYVTDAAGNELDSAVYEGSTLSTFSLTSTLATAPEEVCVYATSSFRGRIIDTAPDAGCPSSEGTLPLDDSGGQEFN